MFGANLLQRKANAQNISYVTSLECLMVSINSFDKIKISRMYRG